MREQTDESYRVCQHYLAGARHLNFTHGRIQGRKQNVLGKHLGIGKTIKERRLTCIRITDQGYSGGAATITSAAVLLTPFTDLGYLALSSFDSLAEHPLIKFNLFFTGPTHTNAAFLSI